MAKEVGHFINDEFIVPERGEQLDVHNPSLGEVIRKVSCADQVIINRAVASAKEAFTTWSHEPPLKRARVIFKFKELLQQNIERIAALVTEEHGKNLPDSRASIKRAIEVTEFACGMPYLLAGSFSENVSHDVDAHTVRQPLGVCVGVTPFNFPIMVPCWMFVPAIACGNTFILKPSEQVPSSTMLLAELMQQAGLPKGVFNIVNGDAKVVDHLITHQDVVAVSCVGSSPVAKHIYEVATSHGKRAQTFGGAKNHGVIVPDAQVKEAARMVTAAAFGAAGERCMAISAAITVGKEVTQTFVDEVKKRLANIKVLPGDNPDGHYGPLISKRQWQRVKDYVDLGVKEGANLVADGRAYKVPGYEAGYFMGPCLFTDVKANMRIYQEEIFGPVLCVVEVENVAEAVKLINEHQYGNAATIFTSSGGIAREFANLVQVGMVGVNIPFPVPIAYHSFGGWKSSFFGDARMHGDESVRFYTKAKSITVRWPKVDLVHDFHIPTY